MSATKDVHAKVQVTILEEGDERDRVAFIEEMFQLRHAFTNVSVEVVWADEVVDG